MDYVLYFELRKDDKMAYSKRVPPIKLVVSRKEYNNLIGILTKNNDIDLDEDIKELAKLTKEKLLKYSIPKYGDEINDIDIEIRLYINEIVDIVSQLLLYVERDIKEINYYEVLLAYRETLENNN